MNDLRFKLSTLPGNLRLFIVVFILTLTLGVTVGLVYLGSLTSVTSEGILEHYRGTTATDDLEIPEKYPKPYRELLLTTHNHVLSFSLIYLVLGFIFSGTEFFPGKIKTFLMVEPFVTTWTTFGSIWLTRFIHPSFTYLLIVSGILMYGSFYLMAGVIIYEAYPGAKPPDRE